MTDTLTAEVAEAVAQGLTQTPKRLPSWLFYDEAGDKIFQRIMRMPEYYLTDCEYEIFTRYQTALHKHFAQAGSPFELVELGAGDGYKTEILLKHFTAQNTAFSYLPVDVSEAVLQQLAARLQASVPALKISPIAKRYQQAIEDLHDADPMRKVFLFLGANIGNFSVAEAARFVRQIAAGMHTDDQLLIGFDLKKHPRLIQAAYDDPHGITRDFNLNLLTRLNRELGAQFDTGLFSHYPTYDPLTGVTKSFLVSLEEQDVYFEYNDQHVHFDRWEVIHTEVSQKYDIPMIKALADEAGLKIAAHFYDDKQYFCNVLFKK